MARIAHKHGPPPTRLIQKSAVTGVLMGLLLTLCLLFPVILLFPGQIIYRGGLLSNLLQNYTVFYRVELPVTLIAMMVSAGAATIVGLATGTIAAWRSGATRLKPGLAAGAISGVCAALVVYIILIAPTLTVMAGERLLEVPLRPTLREYPLPWVNPFARAALTGTARTLAITLLTGGLVGALQGAVVGFLRPAPKNPTVPPTLLELSGQKRGRREWFLGNEEAIKSGILVGLVGGAILILSQLWGGLQHSSSQVEDLASQIVNQALAGTRVGELAGSPLPLLVSPFAFLVLVGIGGAAAFLPHNPPGRMSARARAGAVAGLVAGLLVSLRLVDQLRFYAVLLPQLILADGPAGMADYTVLLPGGVSVDMFSLVSSGQVRILLVYLLSLFGTGMIAGGYALLGLLQGVFYGWIFALLRLRPVDRARLVQRAIQRSGDQVLPVLYRLFQKDCCTVEILEHLVFYLKADPVRARLAAAYHTFGTRPDAAAGAFDETIRILGENPGWKLSADVAALHRVLAEGLRATTLAQIMDVEPVPEIQTSSLYPALAKAGVHLSRPIHNLRKVERVDDLSAKLVFMNNALEALRLARLFAEEGAMGDNAMLYPEFTAFKAVLDQWEGIVLAAIKDLQGRAVLVSELVTRSLTYDHELSVIVSLANNGLNVAEDVHFELLPDDESYVVLEGGVQNVAILSPQEVKELSFVLRPLHARRLRVAWQVRYDDAFDNDKRLEFAGQIEFVDGDKPFQRIFPIPYVTGTPLQSGQMFVGREDVFEYVRQNLFGSYQNNVIVLHGQRRTGKSSILYRLGEILADTHVCVLIDMQGKAARGEADFLYEIADDIVYTLENKGITAELPPRKEFETSPEFFFRSRFLRSVYECLGEKNLMLMFDEFEELQKRVEDGRLSGEIFPYLRNLMQHEKKVDFIFAGTHKLEELAAEYWSILFNIAAYQKITFLSRDEVGRLAADPVEPFGLEYDPLAVDRVYGAASGHPYFTQVICHELVAYHNETQRSYLTTTDVDQILERIVERGEAHFKYIWAESSTAERLSLLALAEQLEAAEAATEEDIAAVLARRGRPLETAELRSALTRLENRDILMRSGSRSSLYRFKVDLIRRWVYATRPHYEKV